MSSPLANPLPWNLVSTDYEREVVPMFETYANAALELAAPPAGSRIVDVACGPGTLSVLAAKRGLAVDALDFSPQMIGLLEARAKGLAVTARVGDGQALPYADGTFAAGFSMFGLMFFPDRAKGFRELRRVLAPGARAVVSSWPPAELEPMFAAMFAAIRPAFGELMKGQPPPPSAPPLTTEDACRAEMSAAFSRVEVHVVTQMQRAPNVDAMWEMMARTMAPLVLLRNGLGDAKWAPHDAAARAAMRAIAGDGPVEVKMPALVTVGVAS